MQQAITARFRLGKLVSKHIIVMALTTSFLNEEIQELLYSLNKGLRTLIIENLYLLKGIASSKTIKYYELDLCDIEKVLKGGVS